MKRKTYESPLCQVKAMRGRMKMLVDSTKVSITGITGISTKGGSDYVPKEEGYDYADGRRRGSFDDMDFNSLWCVALLLTLASWLGGSLSLRAYDFANDGIYYTINGTSVSVNSNTSPTTGQQVTNSYSGEVTIPATVTHDGTTYDVTAIAANAFMGSTSLTKVTIPSSVTSIGNHAFDGCTSLADIIFAEGTYTTLSIGAYAFQNIKVTTLTLPNATLQLGDYSFYNMKQLKAFKMDAEDEVGTSHATMNGVLYNAAKTQLVYFPINWGDGETSFRIPDGVTSTAPHSFQNNKTLTSIDMNQASSIQTYSFHMCKLTSITFAPNTYIGSNAFETCPFVSLDFSNVKSISNKVFQACKQLTTITWGETLTTIGTETFSNCTGLTSVTLPKSLTSIGTGRNIFENCSNLSSLAIEEGNTHYVVEDGVLYDAAHTVLLCYLQTKTDEEFTLPTTVTKITAYACTNNKYLKKVILPQGFTYLGSSCFSGCSSLTDINLADTHLQTMEYTPFQGTSLSGDIVLPTTIKTIYSGGFKYTKIESLTLPATNQNVSIEGELCMNCTTLKKVSYLCGTSVPTNAFSNCTALTEVTLGDQVTSIGATAFQNTKISSLAIPAATTSINSTCVNGVTTLTNLTVDEANTKYMSKDNIIYSKDGHVIYLVAKSMTNKEVHLIDGVTTIAANALGGLTNAETLYLTSEVSSIGSNAFADSGFKYFVLSTATPPTIQSTSFSGLNHDVYLFYPIGSDEAFTETNRGEFTVAKWGDLDDDYVPEEENQETEAWGKNIFYINSSNKFHLYRGYTIVLDEDLDEEHAEDLKAMTSTDNKLVQQLEEGEGGSGIDHGFTWLYRTLKEGWNTVCLPVPLDAEQAAAFFGSGYEVATFTGTDYDADTEVYTMNFQKVEDGTLPANTPCMVKATQNRTRDDYYIYQVQSNPVTYSNQLATTHTPTTTGVGVFNFRGTYYPRVFQNNEFYISSNTLKRAMGEGIQQTRGFRAYFTLDFTEDTPNQARERAYNMVVNLNDSEGQATRIEGAAAANLLGIDLPADIYTLDGRLARTAAQGTRGLAPGIYLKAGRKVLVR